MQKLTTGGCLGDHGGDSTSDPLTPVYFFIFNFPFSIPQ